MKEIDINELNSRLEKGISSFELEKLSKLKIKNGRTNVEDYMKDLARRNCIEISQRGDYRFKSKQIGLFVDKNGRIPLHFPNRETHKNFVKNIFETSY